MTNRILNVAVHDLTRVDGTMSAKIGRSDLEISPVIQELIDDLHTLYARRASKAYGRFSGDTDNYPTEAIVQEYLDDPTKPGFGRMTERLMGTLQAQARKRTNAGTGHVFFAHVENDKGQFLLVVILNDKLGAALTRSYQVDRAKYLDLDGFRFAGRIGIQGWRANEHRYIGFLKGKGDVAEYFREFLGCDETVQGRIDTSGLVNALKFFTEAEGMSPPDREAFLARAKDICSRSSRERAELDFTTLANELVPDEPLRLLNVLTDPDRGLNDCFVPDERVLQTLVKYKVRTRFWSLEFARDALSRGEIQYNADEQTLTIRHLPDELVRELQIELPDG